jgi:hypothetical protein
MTRSLPQKLLRALESGKAILFTGAGFSFGCKNIKNEALPNAKSLAKIISNFGGFNEDEDLAYAADRYLKEKPERLPLIELLKNTFTITKTTESHQNICKLPWMRCYTTNYDNSVEVGGLEISKRFDTAFVDIPPSEYPKNNLVVHINGSIAFLTPTTLNTSFKLTESSYNSPKGFQQSAWYHNFNSDLSRCSAIVFIGYSLYDIDIKRILSHHENLDIYFVTKPDLEEKEKYTFSQYGFILDCGVEAFGKLVSTIDTSRAEQTLAALSKCKYSEKNRKVRDIDIEKLFIFGTLDEVLIEESIVGKNKESYFFSRSVLEDIEKSITKQHIIITSGLGNGKSCLLRQLVPFLLNKSHNVYVIEDPDADIIADIDLLVQQGKHFVLLIDDYFQDTKTINYLAQNYTNNDLTIIATSRPNFHDRERAQLKEAGFKYAQYNLDLLSDEELSSLIAIIDSIGQWGDLAGRSTDEKKRWIKDSNDSSLASFLLSLFDSTDIKNRIEKSLSPLMSSGQLKDVIFSIAFLKIANLPTSSSLISEIAANDLIYNSTTRDDHNFQNLFSIDTKGVVATSSVFALHLLKSKFSSAQIKERFLNIAESFDKKTKFSTNHNLIFKHVLKFSSLERIIRDESKINTLASYYEDLKRRVPWLQRDPHYWLQYGMAQLAHKKFDKAQTLFDTAYSLAARIPNYYTDPIDNQQARLFLKQYILEGEPNTNFDKFENAHRPLNALEDDGYKFKQIDLYREVLETHYQSLSKKNKNKLKNCCENITTSNPTVSTGSYRDQDLICRVVGRLKETMDKVI